MYRIVTAHILNAFVWLILPLVALGQKFEVRNEMVATRDEVLLSTNLYLPKGVGPFSAVLIRTPYSATVKGAAMMNKAVARELATHGYATIIQDCRGTGDSQGKWEPGVHECDDGIDLQKWVLQQSWCNGHVGTYGGSYHGFTQWAVASQAGDSLRAMFMIVKLLCSGVY